MPAIELDIQFFVWQWVINNCRMPSHSLQIWLTHKSLLERYAQYPYCLSKAMKKWYHKSWYCESNRINLVIKALQLNSSSSWISPAAIATTLTTVLLRIHYYLSRCLIYFYLFVTNCLFVSFSLFLPFGRLVQIFYNN